MMTQKHKDLLIKNRLSMVTNLKVTPSLLSSLLSDFTLTMEMKDEIEAQLTESRKAGALVDILMRRGDDAFKSFVRSLVETDQDGLAWNLSEKITNKYIAERDAGRQIFAVQQMTLNCPSNSNSCLPGSSSNPVSDGGQSTVAAFAHQNKDVPNQIFSDHELKEALDIIDGAMAGPVMEISIQAAVNLDLARSNLVYPTNNPWHGRAVIINNHYFLDKKLRRREGAQYDQKNLEKLFHQLGFTVRTHEDQSVEDMKTIFEEERKHPDHRKADMFVLFLLSHGSQGKIYGSDGKTISIESEIADCFSSENCSALAGKPKIFFIQACQGDLKARLYAADSDERETLSEDMVALKQGDDKDFVPMYYKQSDILMSYATVKGYKAFRHINRGSWFVRSLVHVFSRKAHTEHIMDMLTEVNLLLSSLKIPDEEGGYGQLAEKSDTLRKKLYFFPRAPPADAERSS